MITQLVYTSRPNFDPSSSAGQHHVAQIVATARAFNGTNDITGFLVVGTDWFAQVLEGPSVPVSALFRKILQDSRHHHVRLVDTRLVMERQFPDWEMGVSAKPIHSVSFDTLLGQIGASGVHELPIDRILALAAQESRLAQSAQ